ncbi:MAG: hypothetical protein ACRCZH_02880 [Cetobacterium sp.]
MKEIDVHDILSMWTAFINDRVIELDTMLEKGMEIGIISDITGLSAEEINELK